MEIFEILPDANLSLEDSQKWYCKNSVPNVRLTVVDGTDAQQEFYIDKLIQYYEEYSTTDGWRVVLESPLMSFDMYKAITSFNKPRYILQSDNWWRNLETGKDQRFLESPIRFNQVKIEHKTSASGDPCRWYITFWNEHNITSKNEDSKLKEVEL